MKRIIYEWAGIACASLAAVTLAYTVVSLFADRADFKLVFGDFVQIRGGGGQLSFSDALGNGQEVDDWDVSTIEPPVFSDIDATMRGYGFRQVTFADGNAVWYVRLPLAIIVAVFALFAVVCFMRLRRMRRAADPQTPLAGGAPPPD